MRRPGLRLHRLAGRRCRSRRVRRARHLARTPRPRWRSSARRGGADDHPALRRGQVGAGGVQRLHKKKLYGKTFEGVVRWTFVVDEEGTIALAQYNVKATGHVSKLRGTSAWTDGAPGADGSTTMQRCGEINDVATVS